MGRPPIGKTAMTSTERSRRHRLKHRPEPTTKRQLKARIAELEREVASLKADATKPATKPSPQPDTAKDQEIPELKVRIRELERRGQSEGQLTRSTRGGSRLPPLDRQAAEIRGLKSEISKLKAMLQEEPDAAKLRKKVIDQQTEMASMRAAMKGIAKERDKLLPQTERRFREASLNATRETYSVIIKALHSDRAKYVKAAELVEAEKLFIALKPLFDS
jgi:hypothetical protein